MMFENAKSIISEIGIPWLHVFPFSAREGTPAAKMPQVSGQLIKERAAELRRAGDRAVHKHLTAQIGQSHDILMESPTMGRTPQFAEVHFDQPQESGQIVTAPILGVSSNYLRA